MKNLKELIKEVEDHTGEPFDLKNRRHFLQLDERIKRIVGNLERKLVLIEKVLRSETEDSLYDSKKYHVRSKYKN